MKEMSLIDFIVDVLYNLDTTNETVSEYFNESNPSMDINHLQSMVEDHHPEEGEEIDMDAVLESFEFCGFKDYKYPHAEDRNRNEFQIPR